MNQTKKTRKIRPASAFTGKIKIPGDKSISHRAIMLGAIAKGQTSITNLSPGKDVQSTSACFRALGVDIQESQEELIVYGKGINGLSIPADILDAGNSGTTMRLLTGILSAQTFDTTITGDASLNKRPMKRIMTPLAKMGADIHSRENGTAPLRIHGKSLHPIHYQSPVASAQVKSSVLLTGLFTNGKTVVTEPSLSRDHTERMLPEFGVSVERNGCTVSIDGPAQLRGTSIDVPGDISSAAFFMIAAAFIPNSDITLLNVGINPTRTGILDILRKMGLSFDIQNQRNTNGEPRADIHITGQNLTGTTIGADIIPKVIDEIPILAIAATQAKGTTLVKDATELRVKESDRINAIVSNLRAMGVEIEEKDDGFIIQGPQTLKGAHIKTYDDHRIAMAFTIAGLLAEGETIIENPTCAEISYPGFYQTLEELTHVS